MSRLSKDLWIRVIRKHEGKCWYCGLEAKTVDHATARSMGGRNVESNLLAACLPCNNLKGDMTISQFRKYVKVLIIRRLMNLGYIGSNLHKNVKIVFYGEGNSSPYLY